jgi:hypothetical protein
VTDLGRMEWWLGVLAVASVCQVALLATLAVGALRLSRRVTSTLDEIDRHVTPLAARADAVLTDLHRLVAKIDGAETAVRSAVGRAADVVGHVRALVWRRFWPARAVTLGVRAAVAQFRPRAGPPPRSPRAADAMDEARFVAEGGPVRPEETTA